MASPANTSGNARSKRARSEDSLEEYNRFAELRAKNRQRNRRARKKQTYGCDAEEWASAIAECSPAEVRALHDFALAAELEDAFDVVSKHGSAAATPRQRKLINDYEFKARQENLYPARLSPEEQKKRGKKQTWYDPWSPLDPNFTQDADSRINKRGHVWRGSDVINKELESETAGLINGKRFQKARTETGLRSTGDDMLWRIITAVPRHANGGKRRTDERGRQVKKKQLLAGPHKDCRRRYSSKMAALDGTYLSTTDLLTLMRIDLDKEFESYEDLLQELLDMVAFGDLPLLPHFIAWTPDDRFPGRLFGAHLIFLLPANRGVWGKGVHRVVYDAAVAGLTYALKRLGADPGGIANPTDFRNPIGPHNDYRTPNRDVFMSCGEISSRLKVKASRASMMRQMSIEAMEAAGQEHENSQRFWCWAFEVVFKLAVQAFHVKKFDPRRSDYDWEAFRDYLVEATLEILPSELGPRNGRERASCEKAVRTRATTVAIEFDPDNLSRGVDRGACAGIIPSNASRQQKHKMGGEYGRSKRVQNTRDAILEAYRHALAHGLDVTDVSIAELSRRNRRTVANYRHLLSVAQTELGEVHPIHENLVQNLEDVGEVATATKIERHVKLSDYVVRLPISQGKAPITLSSIGWQFSYREGGNLVIGPYSNKPSQPPTRGSYPDQISYVEAIHSWAARQAKLRDHRPDPVCGYKPGGQLSWDQTASIPLVSLYSDCPADDSVDHRGAAGTGNQEEPAATMPQLSGCSNEDVVGDEYQMQRRRGWDSRGDGQDCPEALEQDCPTL